MAITTVEANCNARPTRLAFVLARPDHEQLLTVIARANTLWGGIFNPIVIIDDSTRQTRGVHYEQFRRQPWRVLQRDMLRAFDPDLLITYSNDPLPEEFSPWTHRTFSSERLDWRPFGRNQQSYFVDIFPILKDLWEKEFKGIVNSRVKLKFLEKAEAESSLFLAARFGLYSNVDNYEFLRTNFGAEPFSYDQQLWSAHWPGDFQTLSGLTSFHCRQRSQHVHSHAYFLLNPDDPFDVVDYWNLRASGTYLLPLTLEHYQEFANSIRDFGAASAYPINETVTNVPTIIKAPSITDDQLSQVAHWIGSQGLVKQLSRMGWVPEYHSGRYMIADQLDIHQVEGFEGKATGVLIDGYGKIEGPKPSFLSRGDALAHWSMDLNIWTFRTPDACYHLPWLNSGCDALVSRRIESSHDMDASRVSREGLVVRQDGDTSDVRIETISPIEVVASFLQGCGIEHLRTSSPGLALARIAEMVGGFRKCDIFQNQAIRETLEELSTGKSRLASEVLGKVARSLRGYTVFGRAADRGEIMARAQSLLSQAVEANVFRVGLVFQCSRCQRHNWYAVTEFDKDYNCKSCFSREKTPRLDTAKWFYASDGLFRSANKLDGNITVLLALSFFDELLHHDVKFAPSFEYRLDGEEHEIDFGVIAHDVLRSNAEIVFGESKSGAGLRQEEREKLRAFGKKTGAYLCFCTLADDFEDIDKQFFMKLYEAGIKLILLSRFFLDMDYFAFSDFRSKNHPGRSPTEADWMMRVTVIRTLGDAFAREHHLWI